MQPCRCRCKDPGDVGAAGNNKLNNNRTQQQQWPARRMRSLGNCIVQERACGMGDEVGRLGLRSRMGKIAMLFDFPVAVALFGCCSRSGFR